MATYRLVIRSGPSAGKAFPLEKAEIFIGRDLSNDIVINDPEVSRRHARLFVQGTSYVIEDLGSTNGTSVHGERIIGSYILRPGEVITLGEHVSLVFEQVSPEIEATIASVGMRSAPTVQPSPYVSQQAAYPVGTPPPYGRSAEPIVQPAPVPSYAGQVPGGPEMAAPVERKKFPVWIIVVLVAILVLICLCGLLLWYVDSNLLWCDWFGFLFGSACP
jgi:hypothetical protein